MLTLAGRPSGLQADHYIDSYFPCESRKPIIITRHLCVLRPRSTIRLSHTIRSVATVAQWSRPTKLPIVFEFRLSRTIETDRIRAFSWDQKADGTKRMHMCMPHHSGGGNATKVRRRSTCRNSLRDIFLHDPFLHHLRHAYGFLVLLQNAPKIQFGFRAFWNSAPKLWNVLRQTTREADFSATFRRRLKSHLFSDWLSFFECLLDSLCAVTFLCLPKTVSMILFSFSFEKKKKISFGALIIRVNGTNRYRNGYHQHHHHHHHCYGYPQQKKKKTTSTLLAILTVGVLWPKIDEHVAPCEKTGRKNLTGKATAVLCHVLLFVVLWCKEERSWCLN